MEYDTLEEAGIQFYPLEIALNKGSNKEWAELEPLDAHIREEQQLEERDRRIDSCFYA